MVRSCGTDAAARLLPRPAGELLFALAGNPNVGKSTLFNALTGVGVSTAHYPGTTREIHYATTRTEAGRDIGIVDLPGTYGLGGGAGDEDALRRALLDLGPDVVVVVVDASALARNLYLVFEVLDLGFKVAVAVNLTDEAERAGLEVDVGALSDDLGVPVVSTIATRGDGLEDLVREAVRISWADPPKPRTYAAEFEALLEPVIAACERVSERPYDLTARSLALELYLARTDWEECELPREALEAAERARKATRELYDEPPAVRFARERHGAAGVLAERVVTRTGKTASRLPRSLWGLTTWPWTGIPLVGLVGASVFGFLFFVGDFMASAFSELWARWASPPITSLIVSLAGEGTAARVIGWGFDAGIEASLSIGLPYILTFYFLLGFLEDTGYLNSLAFLTDRAMHRLGLHGRAIIPLIAAAGCSVPALMAARDLPSRRERLVASTLVLFVPCSARTAVILGAVGHYIGWQPAALTFAIVFAVWLALGVALDRMLPGDSSGLVMEMFGFRRPSLRGVAEKAWRQFREFLFVATPIVIVGSLVLGGLYETGALFWLTRPLEPVVEVWLGLPAVAGLTLVLGMLRKELALQLLVALAIATAGVAGAELTEIMTPTNLVVYALVNALALPCISSVAVFGRFNGVRRAALVVGATVVIALVVGGAVARILPAFGWA